MKFESRKSAGIALSDKLSRLSLEDPVILALPRGGIPVGYEIAKKLNAPLDILVVRKLGAPLQKEFAIGAIAEGDIKVLDEDSIGKLNITREQLGKIILQEKQELERRIKIYRGDKTMLNVINKDVILVDDGVATGITSLAAIKFLKAHFPKQIILATPVCSKEAFLLLYASLDKFICLIVPTRFRAVGSWYRSFGQLSDTEVVNLLNSTR
ncbi:phosphoribosyltransferase [Candidatus Daviesbacteria bacterium]|nr:phosphoribosyltransferase [Candidatus Daviesbacteria bacterium]